LKVDVFDSVIIAGVTFNVGKVICFCADKFREETHDFIELEICYTFRKFNFHSFQFTPILGGNRFTERTIDDFKLVFHIGAKDVVGLWKHVSKP
jgi:hypothetical protein